MLFSRSKPSILKLHSFLQLWKHLSKKFLFRKYQRHLNKKKMFVTCNFDLHNVIHEFSILLYKTKYNKQVCLSLSYYLNKYSQKIVYQNKMCFFRNSAFYQTILFTSKCVPKTSHKVSNIWNPFPCRVISHLTQPLENTTPPFTTFFNYVTGEDVEKSIGFY